VPTTHVWLVVLVVGVATIAFKAAGPVFVGRRELPPRVDSVVALIAPVMLTALVVTQTFGGDEEITVDARVPGVAAAALAVWRGVPIVAAMVIAAAVTALLRAVA
jgi:branched-subunit amino acid transport protein